MSYPMKGLSILMVDDSESEIFFVRHALDQGLRMIFFHAVTDGCEAINYLLGMGKFADRKQFPFPSVLLCDIKMPGMGGFGLLRWLRQHPECKVTPTIMFSSSAEDTDVTQSYVLGANAYIRKPTFPGELKRTMRLLYEFWSLCRVPDPPRAAGCAELPQKSVLGCEHESTQNRVSRARSVADGADKCVRLESAQVIGQPVVFRKSSCRVAKK